MTLLPDDDLTVTPDEDEDIPSTTLGVVQPELPPIQAEHAVRDAAAWVEAELARLREQRTERDRTGLAEIEALRHTLIADRATINARIKALVAEQARLARVLRVLDS